MNKLQIFAVIIITGTVLYFLNDVIKHAKARGGSAKQIIARTIIWILIFGVILGINLLVNLDWVPGKWLFSIRF